MFSCEICKIFKSTYFEEHLWTTALHFLWLAQICKSCLEKLPKRLNKIYQLFERIPYNSYFGKFIKRWSQWFQGKRIVGFHFSKFGCCKPTLPKKHSITYFLWFFFEFGEFLRIGIKNNSSWIAQNILSKKVKQVLHVRTAVQEPLYYVIDIFYFLSNTCKYF